MDVNSLAAAQSTGAAGSLCTKARRSLLPERWAIRDAKGTACSANGEPWSGNRIERNDEGSCAMGAASAVGPVRFSDVPTMLDVRCTNREAAKNMPYTVKGASTRLQGTFTAPLVIWVLSLGRR